MKSRSFLQKDYSDILILSLFSILCVSLSMFRMAYTDRPYFMFLNWNLFLAFVPWLLTRIVVHAPLIKANRWITFVLMSIWLLFFPNAPYILTDLFHLQYGKGIPIWFDLVLILSFAWTGLLFGFLSLLDLEKILLAKMKGRHVTLLLSGLLFIAGFGIYLGRYLRWNSWDIISDPTPLLLDIVNRIVQPLDHPQTWGMTILMGIFLNMIYWTFKLLRRN